jgi:hypothetical protein
MVTGIAIYIARAAFAVCPTLESLSIAAYTQRRQPQTGALEDEFVYESNLNRQETAGIDGNSVDPLKKLDTAATRINVQSSFHLEKIQSPEWLSEFR